MPVCDANGDAYFTCKTLGAFVSLRVNQSSDESSPYEHSTRFNIQFR